MSEDEWTKTTYLRKNPNKKPVTAAALDKARASGAVETVKKVDGGVNRKKSAVANASSIENETADFKVATVTHEFKVALMQARQAKKMTQAELAQKIAQKASVVNDYEAGRAIPNQQIISALQRVLGVRLPKMPKKKKAADDEDG